MSSALPFSTITGYRASGAAPVLMNGKVIGLEPTYSNHPMNELEPLLRTDPEREVKVRFLGVLGNALSELQAPLEAGDARLALQRFYGVAMAVGLPCVADVTMTEAARRCNCSRAIISHICGQFCELNGLPNSHHQKGAAGSPHYRAGRLRHIEIVAMSDDVLVRYYESLDPEAQLRFLKNHDYKRRLKNAVARERY
jgi:hypothetical protein